MTDINEFLDGSSTAIAGEVGNFLDAPAGEIVEGSVIEIDGTDPRLKLLSHSSRLTVHSCPRKFQLYRLKTKANELNDGGKQQTTFDFGSSVGVAIQAIIEGKDITQAIWEMYLAWEGDLLQEDTKKKKNFWYAVHAARKFYFLWTNNYLNDYELVYYNGKPAIELSFIIHLPNDYKYRGYVDVVLRHKTTGAILVLELKTTGFTNVNSAMYKNSGQAIGYSIVLDALFPEYSSYTVLYLVYSTPNAEYVDFEFEKSRKQRALWLQELLIEVETLTMYETYETYPMYGESCYAFFRECEYLGTCTLDTEYLAKPFTDLDQLAIDKELSEGYYMFSVDFYDLVAAQLEKGDEL